MVVSRDHPDGVVLIYLALKVDSVNVWGYLLGTWMSFLHDYVFSMKTYLFKIKPFADFL